MGITLTIYTLVIFLVIIGSAVLCHYIAKSRGGNARKWGVIGAIFGPFAIPFAFWARAEDDR